MSSPSLTKGSLSGIAASSARSAWAVGITGFFEPLIMHWNGKTWKAIKLAIQGTSTQLRAVAAPSRGDAWAVGINNNGGTPAVAALRWNGRQWHEVSSAAFSFAAMSGVAATSPRNIWAVGGTSPGFTGEILHWNGKTWTVKSSQAPQGNSSLNGAAALSAKDAWAVGQTGNKILILHWNGLAWKRSL